MGPKWLGNLTGFLLQHVTMPVTIMKKRNTMKLHVVIGKEEIQDIHKSEVEVKIEAMHANAIEKDLAKDSCTG